MSRSAAAASIFITATAWLTVFLAGCAVTGAPHPRHEATTGTHARCSLFFNRLQRAVSEAGVRDSQARPVSGYPYLRVNRFLASFRHEQLTGATINQWVDRLQALGMAAWHVELTNLPAERRMRLTKEMPGSRTLEQSVGQCAAEMRAVDLATPQDFERLLRHAVVPDDYHTMWRILGLYPVTGLFVSFGAARLHHDTRQTFSLPLERLPVHGRLIRYVPHGGATLTRGEVARILARSSRNPLHIPEPDTIQRKRLFNSFAPVWEIDAAGRDDRIGAPLWGADGRIRIDTGQPVVYRLLSHGWWAGRPVLQLNYIIWFPARPATGALDPYAGHVDGITLRVTLGQDGRAQFYDSMHNCGCYHMFFPRRAIAVKSEASGLYVEPALVPQTIPDLQPGQRLVVRVADRTHYLQRLYGDNPSPRGTAYDFADYNTLRTLPEPGGGHRSLFDQHGLVPHSQRAERWWLWPMGVPSPGAMRQWGHHAIAFLGRRHFDDAYLFTSLFTATK